MKNYQLVPPESTRTTSGAITEILNLLGPGTVLLPVTKLSKKPAVPEWQNIKVDSMSNPAYLEKLSRGNIGVLLGSASQHLITIDFDSSEWLEKFLNQNPPLRQTLITTRVRGANLWLRMNGEYPPSKRLVTSKGEEVGEWRADRNQTLIFGEVLDTRKGEAKPTRYRFVNHAPPLETTYDRLVWPEDLTPPKTPDTPPHHNSSKYLGSTCLGVYGSVSLCNTSSAGVLENIKSKQSAEKILTERYPHLLGFYESCLEPHFRGIPNSRNKVIVETVPFLYRALCREVATDFLTIFYNMNRALFKDSLDQHLSEVNAMLDGVAHTYQNELSPEERAIYFALEPREQCAFRICRDLALLYNRKGEPFTFFISFHHLGERIGVKAMQARRIMHALIGYGLISEIQKGTPHRAAGRGTTSIYKWLLAPTEVLTVADTPGPHGEPTPARLPA